MRVIFSIDLTRDLTDNEKEQLAYHLIAQCDGKLLVDEEERDVSYVIGSDMIAFKSIS